MAAAVAFEGVVALLDRFPALAGVDLTVQAGEMVCLRGPNGAGKSTLLRACAGLVPLRGARAEVLGFDLIADRRSVRRHVGLLGHRAPLYGDLRVEDQLRHCAALHSAASAEVSAAVERFALGGRLTAVAIRRLSEGQQRRVALACLTIARPRLWLLDEPHAGLDESSRDALDELLAYAVEAGATVMFATHETGRARVAAARQVVLAGGRVEAIAPAPRTDGPTDVA
ncbi:heme ABC exporter ATP-binding protein CcmA [Candidatus Poriferisodalis sp.]|uniref:heme ABC exporter ATP-binding protein CcmA n=1 Tax=Candidatus Poriferisodalis sp. TaxID=3101277 RepID=UPI003AF784A9